MYILYNSIGNALSLKQTQPFSSNDPNVNNYDLGKLSTHKTFDVE